MKWSHSKLSTEIDKQRVGLMKIGHYEDLGQRLLTNMEAPPVFIQVS
jgi:hypothetical protein